MSKRSVTTNRLSRDENILPRLASGDLLGNEALNQRSRDIAQNGTNTMSELDRVNSSRVIDLTRNAELSSSLANIIPSNFELNDNRRD